MYFISYTYLTKSGARLFDNLVLETLEYTNIEKIESELETKLDARTGRLKILSINKI